MSKPPNCTEDIYKLMKKCWKFKPADRISFVEIFAKLLNMLTNDDHEFLSKIKENSFVIRQLDDDKIQKKIDSKYKQREDRNSLNESFTAFNLGDFGISKMFQARGSKETADTSIP